MDKTERGAPLNVQTKSPKDGDHTARSGQTLLDASRSNLGSKKQESTDKLTEDAKMLENFKYPSMGKLTKMGVTFKPSIRYKIENTSEKNILKDPALESVKAQVDTNRY